MGMAGLLFWQEDRHPAALLKRPAPRFREALLFSHFLHANRLIPAFAGTCFA
jgi:hypothetical protein